MNNPFRLTSFRLIFIYTILLSLSVSLVLFYLYWTTERDLQVESDNKIIQEVEQLRRTYTSRFRTRDIRSLAIAVDNKSKLPTANLYLLLDQKENFITGNFNDPEELTRVKTDEDGWIEFTYKNLNDDNEALSYARGREFILQGGYRLIIGRSINNEIYLKERFFLALYGSVILILFLGIIGGYILSRNFLNRISAINRTSEEIMNGDLTQRLPTSSGNDELGKLSSNLNEMLDRINKLMTSMREVTDNLAHDLRTPLNKIRSNLEVTLMSDPEKNQYKKSIQEAIEEADNLIKTFNSILSISKVESGTSDLEKTSIDVKELIDDLVDLYEPITEGKNILLKKDVELGLKILGNKNLLSQALANLLENAINYGVKEVGSVVALGAKENSDDISIWVSDNGQGIKDSDKEKVLGRFTRLDSSRNTKGSGLGLNLVDSVVKFHRGKLKLLDAKPNGLLILIDLPKLRSP